MPKNRNSPGDYYYQDEKESSVPVSRGYGKLARFLLAGFVVGIFVTSILFMARNWHDYSKLEGLETKIDTLTGNIETIAGLVREVINNGKTEEDKNNRIWTRTIDGHVHTPTTATTIDISNVATLAPKCDLTFARAGLDSVGSNAQVTVLGDLIFFPNVDTGDIWCYNRFSCELVWHKIMAQIFEDHVPAEGSDVKVNAATSVLSMRNALTLFRTPEGAEQIIMGVPAERFGCTVNGDSYCEGLSTYLVTVDAYTGDFVWSKKTSDSSEPSDFMAHYAGSPVVEGDYVYFGTASFANVFTLFGLPCTFRGSVEKFSLVDGTSIWKKYMLPNITEWCGASVWSRMAIDVDADMIYFGTGNAHYHPAVVDECFEPYTSPTNFSAGTIACHAFAETTYGVPIPTDSLVALDLTTGAFVWTFTPGGLDTFNTACPEFGPNPRDGGGYGCNGFKGPDWDFGGNTMLVEVGDSKLVVAGGKSGAAYGVDHITGAYVWGVNLGPGGTLGGNHWAGAYNPHTNLAYFVNSGDAALDGYSGKPLGAYNIIAGDTWICNGGTVHAVNPIDGVVVWQTYDAYANNSINGTFPPECWEFTAVSFSTESFKLDFEFHNTAGYELNHTTTARLGAACNTDTINGPSNLALATFARIHGVTAPTDTVVAVPSMTGNIYLHDAATGDCVHAVSCPKGGVYGGATFIDNQMIVQCGYGKFVPDWVGVTNGNMTRVFELA